ncbi:MAG TPA: EVE domain-containing protein [Pyrinomonadaceae bacterium]|jgi:predicted RNA-binding protein with PUA-like domain
MAKWLWVTGPEWYLTKTGRERQFEGRSWTWTCHKDTKAGDLVLLYRAKLRKDIAYLLEATRDAYAVSADPRWPKFPWDCEVTGLRKFTNPVTLVQLRAAPKLVDCWFLKADLCQSAFLIQEPHWKVLKKLIEKNGNVPV